jgi:UDP-glucose 4-epimerase
MKCVVTGGNGFIGSHLVDWLAECRVDVTVFDCASHGIFSSSAKVQQIAGDVCDTTALKKALEGAQYVFHLSGILGTSELFATPYEAIRVNVMGAATVLEAARAAGVKRVFLPTKPNEWNNIYSVTSQAVEKLGESYRDFMGVDARILRLWNVFGARQRFHPVRKAVPMFILQAMFGHDVEVFGDGGQLVEMLYVKDVVRAIFQLMLRDDADDCVYQLAGSRNATIRQVADDVVRRIGSQSKIVFRPMRIGEGTSQNFVRARCLSELLPEMTATTYSLALAETVDFYLSLPASALHKAENLYAP